jgi:putative RecB family exonuclease
MPVTRKKQQRKPGKLVLSPTKITIYLQCPLMYKLIYIDKIGRYYYIPNPGHSLGGSLHRALQDFHEVGGIETHTQDQLLERLKNSWASAGYSSPEEEKEHLQSALEMIQSYYTQAASWDVKTILTEKQLRVDMGDFILMGRIDRMDEHPDGTLEIIDYKSGRLTTSEDEVRQDLAMGIYQLLARKLYPENRITASILCLRTGDKATVELNDRELEEIEGGVRVVAERILQMSKDTVIEPRITSLCEGCRFERLCKRWINTHGEG